MRKSTFVFASLLALGIAQSSSAQWVAGVDDPYTAALWHMDDTFEQVVPNWPKVDSAGGLTLVHTPDDDSANPGRDHDATLGALTGGWGAARRPTLVPGAGPDGSGALLYECCDVVGPNLQGNETFSRVTDPTEVANAGGDGFNVWWSDDKNEVMVDFWFKNPDHTPTASGQTAEFLVGKSSTWELFLQPVDSNGQVGDNGDLNDTVANQLNFITWHSDQLVGGGSKGNIFLQANDLSLDEWHHVRGAVRGDGSVAFMKVDGAPANVFDLRNGDGTGNFLRGGDFGVHTGDKPNAKRFFTGYLDEVHIWDKVPEPSSMLLLSLSTAIVALRRRRM
ncbi:PEP-CTERM sorting domain-containing protein [Pirellulales bacterium]|nr:PEP-CTERM sorting domain-containing protein [Pirellulales bacterium]